MSQVYFYQLSSKILVNILPGAYCPIETMRDSVENFL